MLINGTSPDSVHVRPLLPVRCGKALTAAEATVEDYWRSRSFVTAPAGAMPVVYGVTLTAARKAVAQLRVYDRESAKHVASLVRQGLRACERFREAIAPGLGKSERLQLLTELESDMGRCAPLPAAVALTGRVDWRDRWPDPQDLQVAAEADPVVAWRIELRGGSALFVEASHVEWVRQLAGFLASVPAACRDLAMALASRKRLAWHPPVLPEPEGPLEWPELPAAPTSHDVAEYFRALSLAGIDFDPPTFLASAGRAGSDEPPSERATRDILSDLRRARAVVPRLRDAAAGCMRAAKRELHAELEARLALESPSLVTS